MTRAADIPKAAKILADLAGHRKALAALRANGSAVFTVIKTPSDKTIKYTAAPDLVAALDANLVGLIAECCAALESMGIEV